MAEDNILKIAAEFDVGPIVAGAQQASAAFDQVAGKATAVGQAVTAASPGVDQLAAKLKAQGLTSSETASALLNLGYSQKEAAAATQAVSEAEDVAVPATAGLATAVDSLKASLDRMNVSRETSTRGMAEFGNVTAKARVELAAATGSVGAMGFGLARLAGQSELLAPIIAAAFPVFGIIAFIALMDTLTKSINGAIDAITGWDDAAKKAYADVEEANLKQINQNIENTAKQREINLVGLEGTAKQAVSLKDLATEQKDWSAALGDTERGIRDTTAQVEHLKSLSEKALVFGLSLGDMSKLDADTKEAEGKLKRLQETAKTQLAQIQRLGLEIAAKPAEIAADQAKQQIELIQARAEATRTTETAMVSLSEDAAKREYEAHRISLTEETNDLKTAEEERISIQRAAFDAQEAVLQQKHKTTGADIGPEVTKLNADREAAELAHQQKMLDIQDTSDSESFRLDQSRAMHRIEIDRQIAAADEELASKKAEIAYRKADTGPEIQTAGAEVIRTQTGAIEEQIAALQKENAVLSQGPKDPFGQLADSTAAEKFAENVAKINALRLEQQRVAIETNEETDRRVKEVQSRELTDELTTMETAERATVDSYRQQEEAARVSFESRTLSTRKYVSEEVALAQQEFVATADSIAQRGALIQAKADLGIISEEEKNKKLEDLDRQLLEAQKRMDQESVKATEDAAKRQQETIKKLAESWARDWSQMVNQVLQGHQRTSVIFAEMGREMVTQLVDKGIAFVVTKTTSYLVGLLAAHSSFIAQLIALDTTSAATKKGIDAASATSEISADAGKAGAAGFASVMEALPFPENVATAPGVMAGAISTTLGNLGLVGAFERGGIIPQTGLAMVHAKEMMLPEPISSAIQGAVPAMQNFASLGAEPASSLSSSYRGPTVNTTNNTDNSRTRGPLRIENHFHGTNGGLTHDDIIAAVNEGMRRGDIRMKL